MFRHFCVALRLLDIHLPALYLIGQQQIQWSEAQTPRHAESLDATALGDAEYPDEEPGYTHTASQGMAVPC